MVETVGSVNVDVKANLDPFTQGLREAQQQANTFSNTAQQGLKNVTAVTDQAARAAQAFSKEQGISQAAVQALGESFSFVRTAAASALGPIGGLIGLAGIGGIVYSAQQAVQAFGQWQQAQIELQGRLDATRGTIGMTRAEINALTQTISTSTLAPQQTLQQFILTLGQSGEVTTETLKRAAEILPSLALRMGDFTTASQALTLALKNPGAALYALRDAGVQFNSEQTKLLYNTALFTDRLQNASVVLDALESQIGQEAAARGAGVIGGFSALSNATSELFTNLGGAIDRMLGFSQGARDLGSFLQDLNQKWFPTTMSDRVNALQKEVDDLTDKILAMQGASAGAMGAVAGFIQGLTGAIDADRAALGLKQIDLQVAQLGQAYFNAGQQLQAYNRSQELLGQRTNDVTQQLEKQLKLLSMGGTRDEVSARQKAAELGLAPDDPIIQRWTELNKQIRERQRLLAQADRPGLFQLENERLEKQIELFKFGNDEMRIRQQLNAIELRAERQRQPLTAAQKAELEQNIRLVEELKRTTEAVKESFTSLFNNMGNALADFAATGKFNFHQFAESVVRDLVRIAFQAFVTKPLLNAVTGVINPVLQGSIVGGVSSASTTAASSAAITGFAEGGTFNVPAGGGSGDKPALIMGLSPGEKISVTPARRAGPNAEGGGVVVINNIQSSRDFEQSQTERRGANGERIIEQTFREVMRRVGRGDGDATFGARFGVRPRTIQR